MELKAKELRIGNLLWEEYGGIYEVEGITGCGNVEMKKKCMTATGLYSIDRLKPIPLTEEWLLKFGFKYDFETKTYHTDNFYWFSINIFPKSGGAFCIENVQYKFIEHVHQLQNLYFALTGKELVYND